MKKLEKYNYRRKALLKFKKGNSQYSDPKTQVQKAQNVREHLTLSSFEFQA